MHSHAPLFPTAQPPLRPLAVALLLGILCTPATIAAQEAVSPPSFALGLGGGVFFFSPEDVNTFVDAVLDFQGAEVVSGRSEMTVGLSAAGHVAFIVNDLFEIRPEMLFLFSGLRMEVLGGTDFDFFILSFAPGAYGILRLGPGRLGAGAHVYYTQLIVDAAGSDSITFDGVDVGFSVLGGLEGRVSDNLFVSGAVIGRLANVDEIRDEDDLLLRIDGRNFEIDLTGIEIRAGFTLTF